MAALNKRAATIQARSAINKWALGFASVAWVPGSHYVMAAGDLATVQQVRSIFGVTLDDTAAASVFTLVAVPLIGSKIAHTVFDFIPVIRMGSQISSSRRGYKSCGRSSDCPLQ